MSVTAFLVVAFKALERTTTYLAGSVQVLTGPLIPHLFSFGSYYHRTKPSTAQPDTLLPHEHATRTTVTPEPVNRASQSVSPLDSYYHQQNQARPEHKPT